MAKERERSDLIGSAAGLGGGRRRHKVDHRQLPTAATPTDWLADLERVEAVDAIAITTAEDEEASDELVRALDVVRAFNETLDDLNEDPIGLQVQDPHGEDPEMRGAIADVVEAEIELIELFHGRTLQEMFAAGVRHIEPENYVALMADVMAFAEARGVTMLCMTRPEPNELDEQYGERDCILSSWLSEPLLVTTMREPAPVFERMVH